MACAAAAYGAGYVVEQMLEKMGVIEDGGHGGADIVSAAMSSSNGSTAPVV